VPDGIGWCSPGRVPSAGAAELAQVGLCPVLAASLCGQDQPCGEELPSHRAGRGPRAWHGVALLCCFVPSTWQGLDPESPQAGGPGVTPAPL